MKPKFKTKGQEFNYGISDDFENQEWSYIDFNSDTSAIIGSSKELIVGVSFYGYDGFPVKTDPGPNVNQYSNITAWIDVANDTLTSLDKLSSYTDGNGNPFLNNFLLELLLIDEDENPITLQYSESNYNSLISDRKPYHSEVSKIEIAKQAPVNKLQKFNIQSNNISSEIINTIMNDSYFYNIYEDSFLIKQLPSTHWRVDFNNEEMISLFDRI